MAKCSGCGTDSARVRSKWTEKGVQLPDECPSCAPQSFEKFTVPSDKKIWMGYEAHPNEYQKKYDKDGIIYERKPEYCAEQEQKLADTTEEEKELERRAVERKRKERRTEPMDAVELAYAMKKAEDIAAYVRAAAGEVN